MRGTLNNTPFIPPSNRAAEHVGQLSLTGHTSGRYMVNATMGKNLRQALDSWVGSFDDLFTVIRDYKSKHPNELVVCYAVHDRNINQYVMELHRFPADGMPIEEAVAELTETGKYLAKLAGSYCAVDHAAHALGIILTQHWHDSQHEGHRRKMKKSIINSIGSIFSGVDTLVVIGQLHKNAFAFSGLSEFILTDDTLIVNAPITMPEEEAN